MKLEVWEDFSTRNKVYHLELSQVDLEEVPLDNFDRALLRECSGSSSIADALLCLEMIARRLEQLEEKKRKILVPPA